MVHGKGSLKSQLSAVLFGGASVLIAGSAFAADLGYGYKDKPVEGNKLEWSAYVQGTTDYIFRGVSQTRREPTLQGGVDVSYGMFYVGAFASGLEFKDPLLGNTVADQVQSANVEIDLYGGIKPKWGDVTLDFGVIWYTYPAAKFDGTNSFRPEYVEFKAGASTTIFKDVNISGTVFYSPDYAGETGSAVTLEGVISKTVWKQGDFSVGLSGTLGAVLFSDDKAPAFDPALRPELSDYVYYNAGVTLTYKEAFSVDLRYHGTNLDAGDAPAVDGNRVFQAGDAIVGTAKVAF